MADKLTIKQEKFVQGLFAGLTQREAYKQAFNCKKMKDKTIDEASCRLATNSKVIARLDELKNELKNRNMVTVERVQAELAKIAFADIKDFLSFGTKEVYIGLDKNGKPVREYQQTVEAKSSDEVDGTLINEVSIGKDGTFKFKLQDKKSALEMLGKNMGMFTDKIDLNAQMIIKVKKPEFSRAEDTEE